MVNINDILNSYNGATFSNTNDSLVSKISIVFGCPKFWNPKKQVSACHSGLDTKNILCIEAIHFDPKFAPKNGGQAQFARLQNMIYLFLEDMVAVGVIHPYSIESILANWYPHYTVSSHAPYMEKARCKLDNDISRIGNEEMILSKADPIAHNCTGIASVLTYLVPPSVSKMAKYIKEAAPSHPSAYMRLADAITMRLMGGWQRGDSSTEMHSGKGVSPSMEAWLGIMSLMFKKGLGLDTFLVSDLHEVPVSAACVNWLINKVKHDGLKLPVGIKMKDFDPNLVLPNYRHICVSLKRFEFRPVDDKTDVVRFTSYVCRIKSVPNRRSIKLLNKLFPYTSEVDRRHTTTQLAAIIWNLYKHTISDSVDGKQKEYLDSRGNVIQSFFAKSSSQRIKVLNNLLSALPVGTNNALVCGVLLRCINNKDGGLFERCYMRNGLLGMGPCAHKDVLKLVGTFVRKTSIAMDGEVLSGADVASLAYYDLLTGRSMHLTDWEAEKSNRCGGSVHIQSASLGGVDVVDWELSDAAIMDPSLRKTDERFYSDLKAELKSLCSPLVSKHTTQETLPDFLARRHEWIASGSSGGFKLQTKSKDGRLLTVKGKKRVWAEAHSAKELINYFKTKTPTEVAHASEKMENGKARAIYGVEPEHYIASTYATKGFEERLHNIDGLEKGASGSTALCLEQKRANITSDTQAECTMLDYADFNRHHTPRAQAALFEVFSELGVEKGSCRDWINANKWVADSKRRMFCLFPGNDSAMRVSQGMFSGTRSTDLLNTLLNLAYFNIARKYVSSRFGVEASNLYHVHQGDDVWLSNNNKLWARLIFYTLHNMGFLFQDSKQMFGQGRGEYLRVLYSGGRGYGYLARSIANFLVRPIQNAHSLDPINWSSTISDGCALLCRRGLDLEVGRALWVDCMNYWFKIKAHKEDARPISLPIKLSVSSKLDGGFGCLPPAMVYDVNHSFTDSKVSDYGDAPRIVTEHKIAQLAGQPTHMSDDWIEHVSKKSSFGRNQRVIDAASVKEAMVLENYLDVLDQSDKDRCYSVGKRNYAAYLTKWSKDDKRCISHNLSGMLASNNIPMVFKTVGYVHKRSSECAKWMDLRCKLPAIDKGNKNRVVDCIKLSDSYKKMVVQSRFRDESVTARAYNSSALGAIQAILSESADRGTLDSDLGFIVQNLISAGQRSLLDALATGSLNMLPPLKSLISDGMYAWLDSQLVQICIKGAVGSRDMDIHRRINLSRGAIMDWWSTALQASNAPYRVIY